MLFKAGILGLQDLIDIRAFNYKVDTLLTGRAYDKLSLAFPDLASIASIYRLQRRMEFLSGIKVDKYDCCVNSCMCYTRQYSKLKRCPFCHEPRRDRNGKPRKIFQYIPLIPRLVALYANAEHSEKLQSYRADFEPNPNCVTDVFDGTHYDDLRKSYVTVNGKTLNHKFFSDRRDIALGISFDGFAPFKRRKNTSWPILIFNYNLPPEERFQMQNLLCVGQIPGPKGPKDADSFLYPLVEELWGAAEGVRAYDVGAKVIFALHVYLIVAFGDIPAVAKLMKMKGHNSTSPCRMCSIVGIQAPSEYDPSHHVNSFTHRLLPYR